MFLLRTRKNGGLGGQKKIRKAKAGVELVSLGVVKTVYVTRRVFLG